MTTRWPCAAHDFFPPSADALEEDRYYASMKEDHEASMKEDHEKTMRANSCFDRDWIGFTLWCGREMADDIGSCTNQKIEWLRGIDQSLFVEFGDRLDCRDIAAMTGCLDSSLR